MIVNMKKVYLCMLVFLSACASTYRGDELIDLKDKEMSKVLSVMGKPVVERKEGNNKMWAYRNNDCTTLVFFGPNDLVQYAEQRGQCTISQEDE